MNTEKLQEKLKIGSGFPKAGIGRGASIGDSESMMILFTQPIAVMICMQGFGPMKTWVETVTLSTRFGKTILLETITSRGAIGATIVTVMTALMDMPEILCQGACLIVRTMLVVKMSTT